MKSFIIVLQLVSLSFTATYAASTLQIEMVPADGANSWMASYALRPDAVVIGNANQWGPGGHPFQNSPSVVLGSFWTGGTAPGAIAFYEVISIGTANDPAAHFALLADGRCYGRTSFQNYPPGIQAFSGAAVFVGDFWDGASPAAAIVDYQVERAGMPLEHSVVHLVYLANGDAWYRVSGWDNTGVLVFNQPPYFLGQFTNESPVSVQKATLGGVKSKYR